VSALLVVGRVRCEAENRDQLIELLEGMQSESRREEGCIRYGFFAAVEEWADREALDRHFAQPHLREFTTALLELLSERPEVAIHEIAGTSGFPGTP